MICIDCKKYDIDKKYCGILNTHIYIEENFPSSCKYFLSIDPPQRSSSSSSMSSSSSSEYRRCITCRYGINNGFDTVACKLFGIGKYEICIDRDFKCWEWESKYKADYVNKEEFLTKDEMDI